MTFKSGDEWNGNKNGAPKKEWTWGSLFKDELDKEMDRGKVKKAMVQKMVDKVLKDGDTQAFKEIANRMDGLPHASIDHTTKGDKMPSPIYGGKSKEDE